MRQPTDRWAAWGWWRAAVAGENPPRHPDAPQCGFYRCRARDGAFLPVSIDLAQDICPETGELVADERLVCLVHGRPRDPVAAWSYLTPISEAAFERLTNVSRFGFTDLAKEAPIP